MTAYSATETAVLAAAYLHLADAQAAGAKVNKAELIRILLAGPLSGRSRCAVEAKFMNMSAVAVAHNLLPELPGGYVKGYKPAPNGAKDLLPALQDAIESAYRFSPAYEASKIRWAA